ncbi:MAG: complex I subunit 1 family protein [Phycisphaerae bacterium]|jgi:NADH-quinone oxidoreductase subunit H
MGSDLFYMLVFPGLAFLIVFSLLAEYVDRKLYARLQHRIGPPWFQPLADLIKLSAKEEIIPQQADTGIFKFVPLVALAAAATAFLYIPLWGRRAPYAFEGDLILVLYLLTIPTVTFFLGGWYSRSLYSMIGAARSVIQLFAYEIPLFLCILAPALLADTWSLSSMTQYYHQHPARMLLNVAGLGVCLVAMLGKLERVPFDIPEAETEIVAGSFTEYSGRLLAMFRLTLDVEMVVGATLIAAVFLPFGLDLPQRLGAAWGGAAGFGLYAAKVLAVVCVLSVLRTVMARLRLDQMINFCWQIAAPVALAQVVVDLVAKGLLK